MPSSRITRLFKTKGLLYCLLALIIAVPAFVSLLNTAYFSMHDDQHIVRLFLLDKAIHEGYVFPRWVDGLGFGYGYPLFNFYPPLIYYVAELFHLIGFSLIWSIKLTFITAFLMASGGMYLLARRMFSVQSALISSSLYTYFFYHGVTGYVRGALAEFFSMGVLPFVFWRLYVLAEIPSMSNALIYGIFFALLIITHPLIAFPSLIYIGFFFLYSYFYIVKNRISFLVRFVIGCVAGLGLSSFFWIPSLLEKKFTLVDNILTKELASYQIHYVDPFQFWYSPWGYGGSIAGTGDGMTFQLGKVHTIFIILSALFIMWSYFKRKSKIQPLTIFIFFLAIFSVFMTTNYSSFIWDHVSFLSYLQFPWRFLTFAGIFIALFGGIWIKALSTKKNVAIGVCFIAILLPIITYQKYFHPQVLRYVTDSSLTTKEEVSWRISKTSFEFVPKGVATKKSDLNTTILDVDMSVLDAKPYFKNGEGLIETLGLKSGRKSYYAIAPSSSTAVLPVYHFPGWHTYVDGQEVKTGDNNKMKLTEVSVPAGIHILELKFKNTPTRTIANLISLFSLVGILFLFLKLKKVDD